MMNNKMNNKANDEMSGITHFKINSERINLKKKVMRALGLFGRNVSLFIYLCRSISEDGLYYNECFTVDKPLYERYAEAMVKPNQTNISLRQLTPVIVFSPLGSNYRPTMKRFCNDSARLILIRKIVETTQGKEQLNSKNKQGKTPLDLAMEMYRGFNNDTDFSNDIIHLLKDNGAKTGKDVSEVGQDVSEIGKEVSEIGQELVGGKNSHEIMFEKTVEKINRDAAARTKRATAITLMARPAKITEPAEEKRHADNEEDSPIEIIEEINRIVSNISPHSTLTNRQNSLDHLYIRVRRRLKYYPLMFKDVRLSDGMSPLHLLCNCMYGGETTISGPDLLKGTEEMLGYIKHYVLERDKREDIDYNAATRTPAMSTITRTVLPVPKKANLNRANASRSAATAANLNRANASRSAASAANHNRANTSRSAATAANLNRANASRSAASAANHNRANTSRSTATVASRSVASAATVRKRGGKQSRKGTRKHKTR